MAETIRKVDYFYIETPNKPGEAAKALAALRDAGVNLLAFTGFPHGKKAQLDFIPEDTVAFKVAAKKAGLKLSLKKTGFLIQGDDRTGAIADIVEKFAAAKVNITAMDAMSAGAGRYGAIMWVKAPDMRKATKIFSAFTSATPAPIQPAPVVQAGPVEPAAPAENQPT